MTKQNVISGSTNLQNLHFLKAKRYIYFLTVPDDWTKSVKWNKTITQASAVKAAFGKAIGNETTQLFAVVPDDVPYPHCIINPDGNFW